MMNKILKAVTKELRMLFVHSAPGSYLHSSFESYRCPRITFLHFRKRWKFLGAKCRPYGGRRGVVRRWDPTSQLPPLNSALWGLTLSCFNKIYSLYFWILLNLLSKFWMLKCCALCWCHLLANYKVGGIIYIQLTWNITHSSPLPLACYTYKLSHPSWFGHHNNRLLCESWIDHSGHAV
jgi:hypothetical protein